VRFIPTEFMDRRREGEKGEEEYSIHKTGRKSGGREGGREGGRRRTRMLSFFLLKKTRPLLPTSPPPSLPPSLPSSLPPFLPPFRLTFASHHHDDISSIGYGGA